MTEDYPTIELNGKMSDGRESWPVKEEDLIRLDKNDVWVVK